MSVLSITAALVSVLAAALAAAYWYFWDFEYWNRKNVKGPKPTFFFGNIKEPLLRKTFYGIHFQDIYSQWKKEKVVGVYRLKTPVLLITDADVLKHIMIKDFDKFVDRGVDFSKKGLGVNLFHAEADTWRVLRSRFSPIFTSGKLKNMLYLMEKSSNNFMNYLDDIVKTNEVNNTYSLISKYTSANISSCAFGLDLDIKDLDDKNHPLLKINDLIFTNNYTFELDFAFPGILTFGNLSLFPKTVTAFFFGMVDKIMSERKGMPSGRKDFMDLLLELKNDKVVHGVKKHEDDKKRVVEITESIMAAQAFVFYAAGFETTASTVTFMLYQLALNQDIQDKVYEEIVEVLAKNKGEITFDSLKDLSYTSRVFAETLRMYPIVDPVQRRLTSSKYTVPGTDVVLDKGTMLLVPVMGIHRDPDHWENPDKFDPDRFLPENEAKRHPCAYLPFGIGPRNCIGMRFAQVAAKLLFAKLLNRYRVVPCAQTQTSLDYDSMRLVLAPTNGIKLRYQLRT